jgi:hypothetical protein
MFKQKHEEAAMSTKVTLRKNASLEAVATEARRVADRARIEWLGYSKAYDEAPHYDAKSWRRGLADMAWNRYRDLNEIAEHLERLST